LIYVVKSLGFSPEYQYNTWAKAHSFRKFNNALKRVANYFHTLWIDTNYKKTLNKNLSLNESENSEDFANIYISNC